MNVVMVLSGRFSVSTAILINRMQGDSFSLILMRISSYSTCQLFIFNFLFFLLIFFVPLSSTI